MYIYTVDDLLHLDADILCDVEFTVGAPLDITGLLMSAWRIKSSRYKHLHPYLIASGCYVISNESGNVLYIGRTRHCFVKYLRVKLGVVRNSAVEINHSKAYWESTLTRLDHSREDVAEALKTLREGRFRVSVVPVYGDDAIPGDRKRAIATLETKLLLRYEKAVSHRPALNYMGYKRGNGVTLLRQDVTKKVGCYRVRGNVAHSGLHNGEQCPIDRSQWRESVL